MNRKFLAVFAISLLFLSCEKRKDLPLGSSGITSNPRVNGVIRCARWIRFNKVLALSQINIFDCSFSDTGMIYSNWDATYGIDVGHIKVNSTGLAQRTYTYASGIGTSYYDSIGVGFNSPFNISISGNSYFPKLNGTDQERHPDYTDYMNLPDTLYFDRQNVIKLKGVVNAETLRFVLFVNMSGGYSVVYQKTISPKETKLIIPKERMDYMLGLGERARIYIIPSSTNFLSGSGKLIQVNKEVIYSKDDIVLKE